MEYTALEEEESENTKMPETTTGSLYKYKLLTTVIFLFTWMNLGITNCVISSTLPDFRHRIGITNEEYGRFMFVVTIFAICGGLVGGVLADRFQEKIILFLAISQVTSAFGHGMIPWSVNSYMATVMFILRNIAHQCCNAFGSAYVVAMWGKDASLYVHLLHAGYPAGCLLGPIIARPFLSEYGTCSPSSAENSMLYPHTNMSSFTNTPTPDSGIDNCLIKADRIEWPYAIGAFSLIISGVLFLILYCDVIKKPKDFRLHREPTPRLRDVCNPNMCSPGRPCFGALMISTFFIFYAFLEAVEGVITNTFLFTYAVEGPFQFTNDEADYLDTAFKGSMLLGRILVLPLSHFVPIQVLLLTELVLLFIVSILLATLGTMTRTYLWIFSCLFNFVLAPLWPGGYTWFDRYVTLYTVVISLTDVFTQGSVAITTWVVGYILDSDNKNSMWVLNSVICGVYLLVVVLAQCMACCYGERHYDVIRNDVNDDVETLIDGVVDNRTSEDEKND